MPSVPVFYQEVPCLRFSGPA